MNNSLMDTPGAANDKLAPILSLKTLTPIELPEEYRFGSCA